MHGVANAGTFAKARCTRCPRAAHARRETLVHELIRVPRGWACLRSRLAVSSARWASASRARCPATEYFLPDGSPCLNTRLQIQANLAAIAVWKAAWPTGVAALPLHLLVDFNLLHHTWVGLRPHSSQVDLLLHHPVDLLRHLQAADSHHHLQAVSFPLHPLA